MRRVGHSLMLFACAAFLASAQPPSAIQQALAALGRGDFASAEKWLRDEVRQHPKDPGALTLLGVALDGTGKSQEAEAIHRRALAAAPQSPDALNNYANHLGGTGDEEGARRQYLAVVAVNPSHLNANVQLARLALRRQQGRQALAYLNHLSAAQQASPTIAVLRMEALYQTGDSAAAGALLQTLPSDPALDFQAGAALAEARQYERAEPFFARVRAALETARRDQPENVGVLYNLAYVYTAGRRPEAALPLLAQAAKLAPSRADVQKLLALTTSDLGALEDSAAAWDRYLALQPRDDAARRERGFAAVQIGRFDQGFADLEWFAARHPDDVSGQYQLGIALSRDDPAKGLLHLNRALELDPDHVPARSARGSLYYQLGKPEAALPDLERAAALRPDDPVALDRLGQTYQALDRTADAVRVLRLAAQLAPDDSKTVLHFARALADAGEATESRAVMDRFRRLGPATKKGVPAGLVDYLTLTPEQRRADYRARVEKSVRQRPADAIAQIAYLKLQLEDGDAAKAAAAADALAALKPGAPALAEAGRALLEAGQYPAAQKLFTQAATAEVSLDLALAAFHAGGPAAGLEHLDRVPETARDGDYFLARARILDAAGRRDESAAALEQALRQNPQRPELIREAAAHFASTARPELALRLLDNAAPRLPRARELALLGAVILEIGGNTEAAGRALAAVQNRWPEWPPVYSAQALLLRAHGRAAEAGAAIDTAAALGAPPLPAGAALRAWFLDRPPREW